MNKNGGSVISSFFGFPANGWLNPDDFSLKPHLLGNVRHYLELDLLLSTLKISIFVSLCRFLPLFLCIPFSAIGCKSVCLFLCFFLNFSKIDKCFELDFEGKIPLGCI